ncbi:site-specific integrase [Pseudomonas cichorii]|nr:site-specific integrase [Pseudomonas cichorii]MBX8509549.1 site-specific integrase [Pseudomonas cichorii]MBX8524410.1 site-specific integrase [Pseudomonas cichorii]MBX8591172.1 site-specific integrase [Pseudomonas cichorii]
MIINSSIIARYERTNFISKDGYEVAIFSDHWKLNKDIGFFLDHLPEWLDSEIKRAFLQVLSIYAQTSSAPYTMAVFRRFRHYFESTTGPLLFSPESVISYRSALEGEDWHLSSMRAFIRTWVSLGYEGVPGETLKMMEGWRIKGNEKGYAVQSMCPESGPLTDIEMEGVVSRLIDCYSDGSLSLREVCYAMILALTGRRPSQIAALKVKDLLFRGGRYLINFPRAKQKYGVWRASFKKYQIVEDLWTLLQEQAESSKSAFVEACGDKFNADLIPELPLFPAIKYYDGGVELGIQLSGDYLHARVAELSYVMTKVKEKVAVISERTGAITHLNPYRFRYTLGTNLAREGRGEYIIAEALDHSDIQNVGVYVKNIPDIVKRIDKAVALQLAPFAQAFQGVIVRDEAKARRGEDRASRVCSAGGNVGTCGSYGFCGALAPIACYTCSHFQPWLDGPHELVLDDLLRERDNVRDTTGDLKIASVNDRLILAVSNVVTRCNAMKSEFVNA